MAAETTATPSDERIVQVQSQPTKAQTTPASTLGPQFALPQDLMQNKQHGTCPLEVQKDLRFGVDVTTADIVSCYNTSLAEVPDYAFQADKSLESDLIKIKNSGGTAEVTFFDSVKGKKLFKVPVSRDIDAFLAESKELGYLSFRDGEVNWDNVRLLVDGNLVTTDGVFLGRSEPDKDGNRYAVNLAAVAG